MPILSYRQCSYNIFTTGVYTQDLFLKCFLIYMYLCAIHNLSAYSTRVFLLGWWIHCHLQVYRNNPPVYGLHQDQGKTDDVSYQGLPEETMVQGMKHCTQVYTLYDESITASHDYKALPVQRIYQQRGNDIKLHVIC